MEKHLGVQGQKLADGDRADHEVSSIVFGIAKRLVILDSLFFI